MPNNFFKKLSGGANKLGEQFLGPNYKYQDYIAHPEHGQMQMSGKGTMGALAKDIAGLTSYTQLLVEGSGNAKIGSAPLGNRFFLKTGGKCKPEGSQQTTDRYFYVDNSPTGKLPFMKGKSATFKGLLPGMLENTGHLNPMEIMSALSISGTPPCKKINKPVTGKGNQAKYVAIHDIPEGFHNMHNHLYPGNRSNHSNIKLHLHPAANLYNLGFGILTIYILFQFLKKAQ